LETLLFKIVIVTACLFSLNVRIEKPAMETKISPTAVATRRFYFGDKILPKTTGG